MSFATGAALAQTAALPAFSSRTVYLPVVGLASTETAQVNVVNLASSVESVLGSTPTEGTTALCTGSIQFYNASGSPINISSTTSFSIGAGVIFSVPLTYSESLPSGSASTARTSVRAVVTINPPNTSNTSCTPSANIETFDTSIGVTHVHAEGSTQAVPDLLLSLTGTRSR